MTYKRSLPPAESRWSTPSRLSHAALPDPLLAWLLDRASLTYRLRRSCPGRFRVQVLRQAWAAPLRNESRLLRLRRRQYGWVREVRLLCDDKPCVFARTVIPHTTLRGARRLSRLGSRPLGAVLFADRRMRRGELQVAHISPGQRLFDAATRSPPE